MCVVRLSVSLCVFACVCVCVCESAGRVSTGDVEVVSVICKWFLKEKNYDDNAFLVLM